MNIQSPVPQGFQLQIGSLDHSFKRSLCGLILLVAAIFVPAMRTEVFGDEAAKSIQDRIAGGHNNAPFVGTQQKPAKIRRYYLIGNSLTWDTVPELLEGSVQFHVDCGKSLPFIYNHPQSPCIKSSTPWPKALAENQYDYVSVQPHYGSTLAEDADAISEWVKLQAHAVFIIHTGWAEHASRAKEFASTDTGGPLVHSESYINALICELQTRFPKRTFRHTQASTALAHIANDIASGEAPIAKIEDLYRDEIHMTYNHGRYLMHNLMRDALDQPRSNAGFTDPESPSGNLNPEWIDYLNSIIEAHGSTKVSDSPSAK